MNDYTARIGQQIGQQMGDDSTADVESLAASARTLASDAEELLRNTASVSNEGIAVLRNKLSESLRLAREQISMAQDYAMTRGRMAVNVTDSYVRDRPWQAVAFAALFGVVLGFMSRGSRR